MIYRDPPPALVHHEPCAAHHRLSMAAMIAACSMALFVLVCAVLMLWMVMSKQDSKLYEADNVVCVSQPFAVNCFKRQ